MEGNKPVYWAALAKMACRSDRAWHRTRLCHGSSFLRSMTWTSRSNGILSQRMREGLQRLVPYLQVGGAPLCSSAVRWSACVELAAHTRLHAGHILACALPCPALPCPAPHCTALHCTASLHCNTACPELTLTDVLHRHTVRGVQRVKAEDGVCTGTYDAVGK
jgi:hypothetical protein